MELYDMLKDIMDAIEKKEDFDKALKTQKITVTRAQIMEALVSGVKAVVIMEEMPEKVEAGFIELCSRVIALGLGILDKDLEEK